MNYGEENKSLIPMLLENTPEARMNQVMLSNRDIILNRSFENYPEQIPNPEFHISSPAVNLKRKNPTIQISIPEDTLPSDTMSLTPRPQHDSLGWPSSGDNFKQFNKRFMILDRQLSRISEVREDEGSIHSSRNINRKGSLKPSLHINLRKCSLVSKKSSPAEKVQILPEKAFNMTKSNYSAQDLKTVLEWQEPKFKIGHDTSNTSISSMRLSNCTTEGKTKAYYNSHP